MADIVGVGLGALSIALGLKKLTASLDDTDKFRNAIRAEMRKRPKHHKLRKKDVRNLDDKIVELRRLANSGRSDVLVRRVAASIVAQKCGPNWCVAEKDWMGESRAVFEFARKNVRYTRDIESLDTFQHPLETMATGAGDCDDYAVLMAALLIAIGHVVRFRVIRTVESDDWDHIFLLDGMPPRDPKQWLTMDASVKYPLGWHPPKNMIAAIRDFPV